MVPILGPRKFQVLVLMILISQRGLFWTGVTTLTFNRFDSNLTKGDSNAIVHCGFILVSLM